MRMAGGGAIGARAAPEGGEQPSLLDLKGVMQVGWVVSLWRRRWVALGS